MQGPTSDPHASESSQSPSNDLIVLHDNRNPPPALAQHPLAGKLPIPRIAAPTFKEVSQRTTRACVQCRVRKTKCDGAKPTCKPCYHHEIPCQYGKSKRERQQGELQSVRANMQSYESLLRDLYTQSNREGISSMANIFNRYFQTSPGAYASFLEAIPLADQHLQLKQPGISLQRMHMNWKSTSYSQNQPVCDKPLVQTTNIQSWTALVDNTAASHLLSLYFAWENPTWNLIDQHMFLYDLEHGSRRFCSPLLVHALLYFGCSYSFNPARMTDRQEEKALNARLYSEIQRLWHVEKNDASLPTAQSSMLIGFLCCTFGIDRLGTKYIMQGAALCRHLGLHQENPPYFYRDGDEDGSLSRCHKLVAWGVFYVQALVAQVYRKHPAWEQPPLVSFSQEEAAALDEGYDRWTPYPFLLPDFPSTTYTAAWARSSLETLVYKLAIFALKFPDEEMSSFHWDYAYQIYCKLLDWRASLPSIILPADNKAPNILTLHLYHQATIISLCDLLNTTDPTHAHLPTHLKSPSPSKNPFNPSTIKKMTMSNISTLITAFKETHGWKSIPIVMLHYFLLTAVHSTTQLSLSAPHWTEVLESCVVGLWHLSLGWGRLCTAFLRTIELALRARNPPSGLVSQKTWAVFKHLESNQLWTARDVQSLAADYVMPSSITYGEEKEGRARAMGRGLEDFIRAMEDVKLDR